MTPEAAGIIEALKQAVLRHDGAEPDMYGLINTPIEGLGVMRADAPVDLLCAIYQPALCLVLQGAKRLTAGAALHEFAAGQSLIVGIDVPVVGHIIGASRQHPYLALAIDLDMSLMRTLSAEMGASAEASVSGPASFVEETEDAVLNCALRLLRLLDRPEATPILRPHILRELHYWLLAGQQGPLLRSMVRPDGATERIARAVGVLRAEFDRPVLVERLAAAAGMSASSFHQHFKAVTSLSPLQFQKQLRLLEARRLMLNGGLSASRAALEVGYESVSQFSREYARMFGVPPRRDISG